MREEGDNIEKQDIGVVNANCPETVDEMKLLIVEEFRNPGFIDTKVGSVIATHAGPGAFGVIFISK
jgi:fatty acid-binding protein DegV